MRSSSRQLGMRVWPSGLRPGPEMEFQTPLMHRKQVRCSDWHGCRHWGSVWSGKTRGLREEGSPAQNVRRQGSEVGAASQKPEGESSKSGECFDHICFQFHLSLVDLGRGPIFHLKCSESSFQEKLALYFETIMLLYYKLLR